MTFTAADRSCGDRQPVARDAATPCAGLNPQGGPPPLSGLYNWEDPHHEPGPEFRTVRPYPYLALTVCLVGCWIRFDREQYTWRAGSSQLLRTGMVLASNCFHVGILFILFGHLVVC